MFGNDKQILSFDRVRLVVLAVGGGGQKQLNGFANLQFGGFARIDKGRINTPVTSLESVQDALDAGEPVVVDGAFALKSELEKGELGEGHAH